MQVRTLFSCTAALHNSCRKSKQQTPNQIMDLRDQRRLKEMADGGLTDEQFVAILKTVCEMDEDELQKFVAGISKVYEKLLRPTGRP